jgi:hypothetical protein
MEVTNTQPRKGENGSVPLQNISDPKFSEKGEHHENEIDLMPRLGLAWFGSQRNPSRRTTAMEPSAVI